MRLEIASKGFEAGSGFRELIERKLRFVLGRFGTRVARVTVHLADMAGQCGDMDKRCRIVARLAPTGQVCVDVTDTELDMALNRAAKRIGPTISRDLRRRRSG